MDFQTSALILAWAAILILSLAMAGILRQLRQLSEPTAPRRSLGLASGELAPPLPEAVRGDGWSGTSLAIFVDSGCGSCKQALKEADGLVQSTVGDLRILAIFRGEADGLRPANIDYVENASDAFDKFKIPIAPYGVIIGQDGRVVGSAPLGSEQSLTQLVQQTQERG